jgi:hypothetical protein
LGRTILRIRGKANESLSELSKRLKLDPAKTVEHLLIQYLDSLHDDEICKKEFFQSSIVYLLELPFAFPYECEVFEFQFKEIKVRIYLERVPKRYVINRLPFRTLATSIIKLTLEDEKIAKENEKHVASDKLNSKYSNLAYDILKRLLICYRRVCDDYYNMGVIEPPVNFEEFQKKVKSLIIIDQQEYTRSSFMPVTEDSVISIVQPLEKQLHSRILDSVTMELTNKEQDFLSHSNEYLDAAIVFYYHEKWDLCLLQSIIAMESATASIVFNSEATDFYLKLKRMENITQLKKNYKDKAPGLPDKIRKFLFPIIDSFKLSQVKSDLSELMPFIENKKDKSGIYDLRSKIVHEGLSIGKEDAKKSIEISSQFLKILGLINENAKKSSVER